MRIRSVMLSAALAAGLALGPALRAQAATPPVTALAAAQAGLDAHIARDIRVLDDVRSLSHDPIIPADQRHGYAVTIAHVMHFRTTTFSHANIYAQTTTAQVTALANRWASYHQEIIDIRSAVQLTDDNSGGYANPADPGLVQLLAQLQTQLQAVAAKGTDVTLASAALARVPADVAAVDAQAEPYFAKLAQSDFRRHALVALEIKQCNAIITTGSAIVAFDNDLLLVIQTAFPGLTSSAHGMAMAHLR